MSAGRQICRNKRRKGDYMINRALNHMAAPRLSWSELLGLADRLCCVGVEFRNDLPGQLFDGASPQKVGDAARASGLRILALAEVKAFNDWSDAKREEAAALMKIAKACGAETVSLIARNDAKGMGDTERRADLAVALRELKPLLDEHDLVGLIETLGFETCALRRKSEAVEAIETLGAKTRFRIVHDTFHHVVAGGGPIFPEHTGMVHISGIVEHDVLLSKLEDPMRVLVDTNDRIDNVGQVSALLDAGYDGPVSFEPFAQEGHVLANPQAKLLQSFQYIEATLQEAMPDR
jgi:2-keto-myo-inositol isomerase